MLIVVIPVDNATTVGAKVDDDTTTLTWIFYIVGM